MTHGATRVLESLRRAGGEPCSGAALAGGLGVTRAQVWKHVEALRQRGYEIDGEPGGGYRLCATPDRLYPEEVQAGLATRWLAREITHLEETDSTNRVAAELAAGGAPHGATVIAEGQSAGRGRLGRSFFSPPHQNLYTSIVLRPALTLAEAPTTILAAGLAVAEAAAATLEDTDAVEIKWPNDVLIRGRKTSGILVELTAEETRVAHLVLGIGVNLNVDPGTFPEEFRDHATSLAAEHGAAIDRAAFSRRLFGALEDILDTHAAAGFAALRGRFDGFFRMRGRAVRVADASGAVLEGTALGLGGDGSLRLGLADGEERSVIAGDVTILKPEGVRCRA